MMPRAGMQALRARAHPLYQARRLPPLRALLALADVPVWARLPGIPWPVRVRLVSHAAYVLLPQALEPSIVALLEAICEVSAPRSFWDVGANFGYYAWRLKGRRPDLEVVMVEPDPANQRLIRATLSRAQLAGVSLHPYAASDVAGTALFAADPVSGATGTLECTGTPFAARHWRVRPALVPVSTRPLDAERAAYGPVDLLKIDVEGHEEAVLQGAREILRRDRPLVVFECFHAGLPAADLLQGLRYVLWDAERLVAVDTRTVHVLALPVERVPATPGLLRLRRQHVIRGRPRRTREEGM